MSENDKSNEPILFTGFVCPRCGKQFPWDTKKRPDFQVICSCKARCVFVRKSPLFLREK